MNFESHPSKWFACTLCCVHAALYLIGEKSLRGADIYSKVTRITSVRNLKNNGLTSAEIVKLFRLFGVQSKIEELPKNNSTLLTKFLVSEGKKCVPFLAPYENHSILITEISKGKVQVYDPDKINGTLTYYNLDRFIELLREENISKTLEFIVLR